MTLGVNALYAQVTLKLRVSVLSGSAEFEGNFRRLSIRKGTVIYLSLRRGQAGAWLMQDAESSAKRQMWNEQCETQIKELCTSLSYKEMAQRLGVSRNAVAGKVYRLGLTGLSLHRKGMGRQRERLAEARQCVRRPPPPVRIVRPILPPEITDIPRKPLLDLEEHECRWPTKEIDGKQFFCADKVADHTIFRGSMRSPYCEAHHARGFQERDQ